MAPDEPPPKRPAARNEEGDDGWALVEGMRVTDVRGCTTRPAALPPGPERPENGCGCRLMLGDDARWLPILAGPPPMRAALLEGRDKELG